MRTVWYTNVLNVRDDGSVVDDKQIMNADIDEEYISIFLGSNYVEVDPLKEKSEDRSDYFSHAKNLLLDFIVKDIDLSYDKLTKKYSNVEIDSFNTQVKEAKAYKNDKYRVYKYKTLIAIHLFRKVDNESISDLAGKILQKESSLRLNKLNLLARSEYFRKQINSAKTIEDIENIRDMYFETKGSEK